MAKITKAFKWFGFLVKASTALESFNQVMTHVTALEQSVKRVIAATHEPEDKKEVALNKAVADLLKDYYVLYNDIRAIRDTFR